MSDYGDFARFYDRFTQNVNYPARARYFDAVIQKYNPDAKLLLDLACGTGSLSFELEEYGYDIVAVDNSYEMLSVAAEKRGKLESDVLFLCQEMSELDLCCILGNLFDNAIEASMPLPKEKRLIRVYMDMKGTQLYISFTNFTSTKKLTKLGNSFATTKGEGHGFGLVRIDNIVDRLDGYLSRNSEDGAFTTEILIPQV